MVSFTPLCAFPYRYWLAQYETYADCLRSNLAPVSLLQACPSGECDKLLDEFTVTKLISNPAVLSKYGTKYGSCSPTHLCIPSPPISPSLQAAKLTLT